MDYLYLSGTETVLIETMQSYAKKEIVEKYITCRKEKNLTQEELAIRVGVPRSNITRFESGTYNPSLEMMVKVALALGMRLNIDLQETDIIETAKSRC